MLTLIAIIVLILFIWLVKSLEYGNENHDWVPLKLPLWAWLIVILVSLCPIFNVLVFVIAFLTSAFESNMQYREIKFKKNKTLGKIKEFFSKRY